MVPDALLLELHPHTHTAHPEHTDTHEAQVGLKHKHCPVEDMFGKPFQGSLPPLVFKAVVHRAIYTLHYTGSGYSAPYSTSFLRGPPVA